MNQDVENIIAALSPEIEKKCLEIRETRKERKQAGFFVVLCFAFLLIPTLFVFFGLNLFMFFVPLALTAAALFILSPILINQQGGHSYEQA